jgi:hypothetical protein
MSANDFAEVVEGLFAKTYDDPDRDYYEEYASEAVIPDPDEASKEYIKLHPEAEEIFEPEDDDDEDAYESFSPEKIEIQKKYETPIKDKNIIKKTAETDDMFKTRSLIFNKIKKETDLSLEQCDMYSRCLINYLWFGITYNKDIQKSIEKILNDNF